MLNWDTWLKDLRSGRFICLIVMLVFGSFAITTTCLLTRSDKNTEKEHILMLHGDYDAIVYNTGVGFEDSLSSSEKIDEIGLYYELGTVTNVDGTHSFKAVALKDSLSEDIYHMTCIRGCYPTSNNEIAIDVSVASTYGIAPYPGETLQLKLYDSKGEYIETKYLVVSGLFQCSSNNALGGWVRCPDFAFYNSDAYQMPAVFFFSSNLDSWTCEKETVFVRGHSNGGPDLRKEIYKVLEKNGQACSAVEDNYRLEAGYSDIVVGFEYNTVKQSYGSLSRENIQDAVDDGQYKRDFYADVVFPIISILVILTEVVSLFMLSKNLIADRKEYYAILRSIGMPSRKIIRNLVAEILGFGFVGAIVGIGMGYAAHGALIKVLNDRFHLRLYDGIHVDQIVKQITFDPTIMSMFVCICSLTLSLIIPLYRLYKMYPAELLSANERMFVGKRKAIKTKKTNLKAGWLGTLNRRIDLHDGSTMLVMVIVLSSTLFGYVFFRAYSEQSTIEAQGALDSLGIDGNGYVASRSKDLVNWAYIVPNRHDAGILPSVPELIENNPNVERSWSVIFNESTRMVFDEEPDEDMKLLLGNRLINYRVSSNADPYYREILIAEPTIFEHTGYEPNVLMYELPTVGLTTNEMTNFEGEVIAGRIDIDKISSGEEVVLAIPQELKDLCLQRFPIGFHLSFDDIVLNEEEEKLNFKTLNDSKWVVYENDIETEMGKSHVAFGAFGKRYGVDASVGAIVVLHDDKDIREYLTTGDSWVYQVHDVAGENSGDAEPTYGISVLCLADSFKSWGLPDRNYTSVRVELKANCDIYEFDEFWYKSLSGSKDVQTDTTFTYMDEISMGRSRGMAIFFTLIFVLVILGIMSIITGLYTKTRSNSSRFQTLRRVGLSVNQASIMIYTQNMFYPIVATLLAIVPVYYVQSVLNSIMQKLHEGKFDIFAKPWYIKIPYWADLFSYDFVPALICCLLLGFLLIFIGTLPQILYLHKMKMIETREE